MKYTNPFFRNLVGLLLMLSIVLGTNNLLSQSFQKHYGTPLDNSFSKVIQDGTDYYVLGQDEKSNGALHLATVTRLDANGNHIWTLSMDTPSFWSDAVLLPGGDLMVVGYSLPLDATTKSIIGRVTNGGTFTCLKSFNQAGRNFFNKVVEQAGSYYVLASEIEFGGSLDNVALWNFDASCNVNWKKYYISPADDEFVRDLVAIPGGGLLMAGNDAKGVIYTTDNAGIMTNNASSITDRVYRDVEANSSGGFYAAASNFNNNEAYLEKFDASVLLLWEVQIQQLTSISQVWEGLTGDIYVTGAGIFGGQLRTVIIKLIDIANIGPFVSWVKYLNAGTNQMGGCTWLMSSNQLAFTDARTLPGGFGQTCAFMSISDLELNEACMVSSDMVSLIVTDPTPDGPLTHIAEELPPPNAVNIVAFASLNWLEGEVCSHPDDCCLDEETFCTNLEDNTSITIDNSLCKVTLNISSLPACDSIEWINWGDSPVDEEGPFGANSMPMHKYGNSGTYIIKYFATEKDPVTGFICFEKLVCDTIELSCPNCDCQPDSNLVMNGDFEQGNILFSSDLTSSGACVDNTYLVGNDFTAKCIGWPSQGDHTTGTGNFMIVDGSPTNSAIVWSQSVNVVEGMTYCFSFWTASIYCASQQDFDLQVEVESSLVPTAPTSSGVGLPNIVQPCPLPGQPYIPTWINHTYTWTCPTNFKGPYTLIIRQLSGSTFTDFGIDDICFSKTATEIDTCCTDFDAFCALVAQGFTVVTDPALCKATLTAPQFDTCQWFSTPPFIPGTSVPQVITDTDGMWMFNYNQSGLYTICVNVFEEGSDSICWQKEMCTTFDLFCDPDPCCTDFDTFLNAAQAVDVLGELGDCMLHYNTSGLDSCMQISFVWGDFPQIVEGPYPNDTAVWHTYSGPGIYNVCYLIEQVSPPDSICWAYEHCEDIEIICDTCYCGDFTDMIIHVGHGVPNHPVSCGGDTVTLGCPLTGLGYVLAGEFACHGNVCPIEDTLSWTLTGPGVPHSGTAIAYPYFTIQLLPTYFAQPGLYTLVLNGHCGNEECVCIINFYVDCPNLCPCDVEALGAAVDQGFAQSLYSNSCKACFSPVALSDCETVEWHIGSINNPPIASSVGNQTICHNFNNPGTYTIIMVVTRLRPDGTICEVFVKSQTVTVNCVPLPICDMSIFPNPGFAEGAVEGGLNSGGASSGWIGIWGDPHINHSRAGSLNEWTIELQSNNADTVDVLSTLEPVCINKGTGVISIRMERGIKEKGIKSAINISLLRGDDYTLGIDWTTTDCHVLIDMDISPIDTGEWLDIEIPYDITAWMAEDDCTTTNGVLVRPVIRQRCCSRPKDLEKVYLDYFCMGETPTATDDLAQNENIRIFPNPTDGNFTLQFDNKVPAKCKVQIIDVAGRILQSKMLNLGDQDQGLNISNLSSGIYFIKILENDNPVWVEKIIKL